MHIPQQCLEAIGQLPGVCSPLFQVGPRDLSQVFRFGGSCLSSLRHVVAGPSV